MSITLVRRLAWFALAAQVLFVASWVVAGALEPGYSHLDRTISDLGARFAEHPWIANAGFIVLGLSIVALAPGVLVTLPKRPARAVTAGLLVFCGLAMGAMGLLHIECSFTSDRCSDLFEAGKLSWQTEAHVWLGLALELALVATPFALARSLWPRPIGAVALIAGAISVLIGLAALGWARSKGAPDGLIERWELGTLQIGLVLLAIGILYSARREPAPSAPTPLPPRDFFGSAWSGQGEVHVRPSFLGRLFAQRFRVSRTPTWISDDCWVLQDRATFSNGWEQSRRVFCELIAPDRIRVTAPHLPEGASISLDDHGYRIWPYELLVPLGPLSLLVEIRDQARVEPDGEFVDDLEIRLLGVTFAKAVLRVRPEPEREPQGPGASSPAPAGVGA